MGEKRYRTKRTAPRAKTLPVKSITWDQIALGWINNPYPVDVERPTTRGDCKDSQRPCPWVSCSHHMYLDINAATGSIKFNFPDKEPWELDHTCSLDLADIGGLTLEAVAAKINLTRERVRQIEVKAFNMARTAFTLDEISEIQRMSNDDGLLDWQSRVALCMLG